MFWVKVLKASNNLILFDLYLVLEFLFLTLFLKALIDRKWPMWLFYSVIVLLVIQFGVDPSVVQGYNGAGVASTHMALVLMCISYLYRSLSHPGDHVMLVAGLLLYLPISTITFLAGNLVFDPAYAQSLSLNLIFVNSAAYFGLQLWFIFIWLRWLRRPSFHSS